MSAYLYPIALALISAGVMLAERLWPARPGQKQLRRYFWSDLLHLVFNGHFLGVLLFLVAVDYVLPVVDGAWAALGVEGLVYRRAAEGWPLWVQIPVAMLLMDFMQWGIHILLHKVPWLWEFHKTHHSVVDGEMDWIVSFRFQWMEVVVYKSLQYLPLAFLGFGTQAVLVHAIFGTLIGHLNHSNLDLGYGWWRYILNNPRMHLWHHDYARDARTTVNFGIIFSGWDWIFGTAEVPPGAPEKIGFDGVERFPRTFFGHLAWPLVRPWVRPRDEAA